MTGGKDIPYSRLSTPSLRLLRPIPLVVPCDRLLARTYIADRRFHGRGVGGLSNPQSLYVWSEANAGKSNSVRVLGNGIEQFFCAALAPVWIWLRALQYGFLEIRPDGGGAFSTIEEDSLVRSSKLSPIIDFANENVPDLRHRKVSQVI